MSGFTMAMADMRGNVAAGFAVLILGVVVLRIVRGNRMSRRSVYWCSAASFIAGPAIAALCLIADLFWIAPGSYDNGNDVLAMLLPMLAIGLIAGTAGAIVLSIGSLVTSRGKRT